MHVCPPTCQRGSHWPGIIAENIRYMESLKRRKRTRKRADKSQNRMNGHIEDLK